MKLKTKATLPMVVDGFEAYVTSFEASTLPSSASAKFELEVLDYEHDKENWEKYHKAFRKGKVFVVVEYDD